MNIIHYAATHRSQTMATKKLIYPAADRNKDPILSVLKQYILKGENQNLLEISSGSGQHVAHFAPHFPHITFYPSDIEDRLLESIDSYANSFCNIKKPIKIDITTDFQTWNNEIFKKSNLDYIYNANMIHISPFETSIGLFENAGKLLKPNAILFTYGAYAIDGKITPKSNVDFDQSLRLQNPSWGIREIRVLEKLAKENGIDLMKIIDMPANNKMVIWKKM